MTKIAELRALAKRRQRAANNKISRLRGKGVELANTRWDTRQPAKNIDKMNSRQLSSYVRKLDTLVSRKTAFVPGAQGIPIPAQKWAAYQNAKAIENILAKANFNSVANTAAPNAKGMTIAERRALTSTNKGPYVEAANAPYTDRTRNSRDITSEEGLDKLIAATQKKLDPNYVKDFVRRGRWEFGTMMDAIGKSELIKETNKLSDYQFQMMWSYSGFADNASLIYEAYSARIRESKDDLYASQIDDSFKEIYVAIDWASKLQEPSETKPKGRARK